MRIDNPFKIQEGTIRDRRLSGYNTDRSTGDNLLFMPDFSGWIGKTISGKQVLYFYAFVILIFVLMFMRVMYLQLLHGAAYRALADNNRIKTVRLLAPRGIMYDRYQRPLMNNVSTFSVYVNPALIQSDDQASELEEYLLSVFPESRQSIETMLGQYRTTDQEVLVADDVPYDTAMRILIASSENAALQVSFEPRREYLVDAGIAPILGYVGSITEDELKEHPDYRFNDVIGKSGIEKWYESILRGEDGYQRFEVDALGREKEELGMSAPKKGSDLELTVDMDVQRNLYRILSDISRENGGAPAAAVILQPTSGEILGMASYPSYAPSIFTGRVRSEAYTELLEDPLRPLFARAYGGVYPAGSVFKLAIAAAALDEGIIDDRFTVMSTGGVTLGGRLFPDWRLGGHGLTNVYKAVSDSVNTFFYIVGGGSDTFVGLGVDLIEQYARRFGFGTATGLDLPGEAEGFVPSRAWKEDTGEKWYQGDTYNLSIGQGALTVTPIQVARYTAYFANTGTFVTPHVVRSYVRDGSVIQNELSSTEAQGVSAETIRIVRQGMRRTVTDGTATSMQSVSVPVAGKTGTAQFNRTKDPHSWFTGFAPYDNPELVITVIVEEGGERGLAVTAARRFLEWYFNDRT